MDAEALLAAAREDLRRGWSVRAGTRLRQAAEAGSDAALITLADALLKGRLPGGPREARARLEAATRMEPAALMLRAALRFDGIGGPAAPDSALEDLGQAALDGSPEAAIEIALVWHERGDGEATRAWLARAAPATTVAPLAHDLLNLLPAGSTADDSPIPDGWAHPHPPAGREELSAAPRIERFRAALSPLECTWLRALARPRLAPSLVADPETGAARPDPTRTGATMCFEPTTASVYARRLAARMAGLAGYDPVCAEPLAVLRYRPGQQYKPHFDWLGPALARDPLRAAGDRAATVLAYLNVPEAGGATVFPRLNLRVEPEPGMVLAFANLDAADKPHQGSRHAGEPVITGEKWLASLWLRMRPVRL